jgi:hypothetical protein
MIDEVLLTNDERKKEFIELLELIQKGGMDFPEWELDTLVLNAAKTAQLKLLEWLKEDCTDHSHRAYVIDGHTWHKECPECLAELESKLKEGR